MPCGQRYRLFPTIACKGLSDACRGCLSLARSPVCPLSNGSPPHRPGKQHESGTSARSPDMNRRPCLGDPFVATPGHAAGGLRKTVHTPAADTRAGTTAGMLPSTCQTRAPLAARPAESRQAALRLHTHMPRKSRPIRRPSQHGRRGRVSPAVSAWHLRTAQRLSRVPRLSAARRRPSRAE